MYFRLDGSINYKTISLSTVVLGLLYTNAYMFNVSKVSDTGMKNYFNIHPYL